MPENEIDYDKLIDQIDDRLQAEWMGDGPHPFTTRLRSLLTALHTARDENARLREQNERLNRENEHLHDLASRPRGSF